MSAILPPADYHIHTPLCNHAEGWPVDALAAARAAGLDEIGISDHNPSRRFRDGWRMATLELPAYLDAVAAAIELGSIEGGPSVRLGLECDWYPGEERWIEELAGFAPWDYFIGAVHYIADDWDVDNPRHATRIDSHGVTETWDLYWAAYTRAAASGLFDIMAHPDLVKKFGHRPPGDLRRYYEPAIAALAASGAAFELNTAGWRKDCAEPYPDRRFLEMAALAGIPLVISSDAHAPGEVGFRFGEALALARESGFTRLARFAGRKRRLVPIDADE
jgi:histidinol-phosphatase (PHP family)